MEAIRAAILGKADRLLAKAVADDAEKYAPSTLDKARSARSQSNAILTADRYNRDEAVAQATRAEYEARHASNIGLSVRSLERNDQAWEKLMLGYEIQMNRVGEAFALAHLPFDDGPQAATDQLVTQITELQAQDQQLSSDLAGVVASLTIRPVIGVPMDGGPLKGQDALLSTVMMPGGIPVGTVVIGKPGAKNAAYLAAQIMGVADENVAARLKTDREANAEAVRAKDAELQKSLS